MLYLLLRLCFFVFVNKISCLSKKKKKKILVSVEYIQRNPVNSLFPLKLWNFFQLLKFFTK